MSRFTAKKRRIVVVNIPHSSNRRKRIILLDILLLISLTLLTIIAARPGTLKTTDDESSFREVVFVLDTSGSMETVLSGIVKEMKKMISESVNTKFALVVFQSSTYTLSPLTSDKEILIERLEKVTEPDFFLYIDENAKGGTDIFNGLSLGLLKFPKDSKEYIKRNKSLVLITDGEFNTGENPEDSIPFAIKNKINLYPLVPEFSDSFNDKYVEVQKNLAKKTGGKYFVLNENASNSNEVIDQINNLSETKIKAKNVSRFIDNQENYIYAFVITLILYGLFSWRRYA